MIVLYNVDVLMEQWPICNWVLIGVTSVASVLVVVNRICFN